MGGLRRNKLALVGLFIVLFLLLVAIFGPLVTPYDYRDQNFVDLAKNKYQPIPRSNSATCWAPTTSGATCSAA